MFPRVRGDSGVQTELLNRKSCTTVVELSMAMADYIENFHNTRRRHSSLEMLTSTEYETTNHSRGSPT